MKLPKKISPDSIREAIVEFRYTSALSFEIIPGILFKAFDNSYNYTDRPIKPVSPLPISNSDSGREIRIQIGNQSLLYNDLIILQILPNSFVFSCLNNYIGWEIYQKEIYKALKIIENSGILPQWMRLGVRYISEYREQDLQKCTKFKFTFGFPEIESETVAFKTEFKYKNSKVILNLNNRVPLQVPIKESTAFEQTTNSIIDIDLLRELQNVTDIDKLSAVLNEVHLNEKEIFFELLQEEFLKTLQPEY